MISAAPIEVINHFQHIDGSVVYEVAVIRLENEKYLFIAFSSDNRFDEEVGVTDIEEFDNREEAVKIYNESVGIYGY